MLDAYIYTGLRSPFGRHAGALARMRPDDMLAEVIAKVVAESGFAPEKIEDVVVGCANQGGEDSRCVARHAALRGRAADRDPGLGVAAQLRLRAQRDRGGGAGHHLRRGRRVRRRRGREHEPRPLRDGQGRDAVQPRHAGLQFDDRRALPEPQGRGPLRRRHDAGDRRQPGARLPDHPRGRPISSPRARRRNTPPPRPTASSRARSSPVEVPGGRAGPVTVAEDEHPRPQTDMAALAKLRPLFKDGVTTAGNASGINDGAVAMIVASRKAGDAAGAKPLGAHRSTAGRRRRAAHHGLRPGAGREKGAGARRPRRSRTWT